MTCLVQQLFRQKIGKELDSNLVDDVLFPLLRSRKQLARELLLDIKLTQSCNEHGLSAIVICRVIDHGDVPQEDTPKNISPFEVPLAQHNLWLTMGQRLPGKIPSQMRRLRHMSKWGSIDILNELRSLKHPQIRDHTPSNPEDDEWPSEFEDVYLSLQEQPPSNPEDQDDWPSEFEDVYLSLQEQPLWPRVPAEKIADDLNFVNDYLEDALNNGKRISWGGDPTLPNNFDAILSTYYY
jgi:hypothetical protein